MNTFKRISEKDLLKLNKHYLKFEPYSDFNVVSLWGYMVPGARYIHHKEAVLYELLDYNNDETYLSILGDQTSRELVAQVAQRTQQPTLTLCGVPESTCNAAFKDWPAVQSIEEDIDNHDYIFSVENIAHLGENHKDKRKILARLARKRPNLQVRKIDHSQPNVRNQMYRVFKKWIRENGSTSWQREFRAIKRMLKLQGFNVVCIGAFDKDRMVGFTVNEIEKNDYYQGHYGKAGYQYPGLGLLLECETAKIIGQDYGSKFMNLQQDLGIEGIRYYKQSLHPLKQLKKYTVVIDTERAKSEN